MNIFEDLIEELKEENLIEKTVQDSKTQDQTFDQQQKEKPLKVEKDDLILNDDSVTEIHSTNEFCKPFAEKDETGLLEVSNADIVDFSDEESSGETFYVERDFQNDSNGDFNNQENSFPTEQEFFSDNLDLEGNEEFKAQDNPAKEAETPYQQQEQFYQSVENDKQVNEKEFYRKRAMEEVSGLQMVEHVISGVEREQMKIAPKPYDDLGVKKALHHFMQVVGDVDSPEHAQTEYQLMQETQNWCSALSHRDRRISVAHLRRYCETTRPVLSSQALLALARFYRNLPYTESVRSKYDLVITKLFSRDVGMEKRELVFTKEEMTKHLKDLYAEWESIQLYPEDDKNSQIVEAVLQFRNFIDEAEKALNFDELVNHDFFNRLRLFKESTNELFFSPTVATAAIECNIRIGNKYIELIERERRKTNSDEMQDKYGFLHDQAISDAASKTLQLVELLKEISTENKENDLDAEDKTILISAESLKSLQKELAVQKKKSQHPLVINKWLATLLVLVCFICGGLYVYVEYYAPQTKISEGVQKVNVEDSYYKDYFQTARISEETYYAVTTPAWDLLDLEKREEILKNVLTEGERKGYRTVQVIDKKGRTVGQASKSGVKVLTAPE